MRSRERERERFKHISLYSKSYPLVVLLVVGLNKDEFYLDHPFGVVAVFDATSCFVDEYYE